MSDLLTLLKEEQMRVAKALPGMAPGTEEYTRAFDLLRGLRYEISEIARPLTDDFTTPPPAFAPVPAAAAPVENSATGGEEPAFDADKFRASLRERMADARLSGVNTTELLKKVGAAKLSAVTEPAKLKELSELVDAAVKEKG